MVQVSADNNILVAGGDDDLIHIWNIHSEVQYTNIKGRDTPIEDFYCFVSLKISLSVFLNK